MTGFIHALLARQDRPASDPRRWEGLPEAWNGQEPSIPMLANWIAYAQFAAAQDKSSDAELDAALNGETGGAEGEKDAFGAWIKKLCEEVNPEVTKGSQADADGLRRGTTGRGFTSLTQLIGMADRERSGVIGTMDQALLPFKNMAVEQRTDSSDFTPDDLRGTRNPDGSWTPMTLYICVNQAEAAAFSTITALLFEILSRSLLTYKDGDYNPRTSRQLGPFKVCFAPDEFAKLPRERKPVMDGTDLMGRAWA